MRDAAASMRAARQVEAAQRKAQEQYYARMEVEEYESTVAALTSVHRECSPRIHWPALVQHQPTIDRSETQRLEAQLAAYRPTLWERLWSSTKRRDGLASDLLAAQARERDAWSQACAESEDIRRTASLVLAGDAEAYNHVVSSSGCLDELEEFGCQHRGGWLNPQTAWTVLKVGGPEIVPTESKSLTASGKLSTRKVPAAAQMETYQDFVCGVALRVARELSAVLPLQGVYCDVRAPLLDTRTGIVQDVVVLSVLCPADRLSQGRVNFDRVDASDLVTTFQHAMKLARGKGLQAVDSVAPVRALTSNHG